MKSNKIDIKKEVGNNIKKRRFAANYSQTQFGSLINLSRGSVVNIESGRHSPPIETIYIICCILKCTPNDLFPSVKNIELKSRIKTRTIVKKERIYSAVKI